MWLVANNLCPLDLYWSANIYTVLFIMCVETADCTIRFFLEPCYIKHSQLFWLTQITFDISTWTDHALLASGLINEVRMVHWSESIRISFEISNLWPSDLYWPANISASSIKCVVRTVTLPSLCFLSKDHSWRLEYGSIPLLGSSKNSTCNEHTQ